MPRRLGLVLGESTSQTLQNSICLSLPREACGVNIRIIGEIVSFHGRIKTLITDERFGARNLWDEKGEPAGLTGMVTEFLFNRGRGKHENFMAVLTVFWQTSDHCHSGNGDHGVCHTLATTLITIDDDGYHRQ